MARAFRDKQVQVLIRRFEPEADGRVFGIRPHEWLPVPQRRGYRCGDCRQHRSHPAHDGEFAR